jgi:hypothetical protein
MEEETQNGGFDDGYGGSSLNGAVAREVAVLPALEASAAAAA